MTAMVKLLSVSGLVYPDQSCGQRPYTFKSDVAFRFLLVGINIQNRMTMG